MPVAVVPAPAQPVQAKAKVQPKARAVMNGRYGSLHSKYNDILNSLPPDSLPTEVPAGKHSYHVVRNYSVIDVNLQYQYFAVTHPCREDVSHSIYFKKFLGGAPAAWILVRSLVRHWARNFNPEFSHDDLAKQAFEHLKELRSF